MVRGRLADVTPISGNTNSANCWAVLFAAVVAACSHPAPISAREAADASDTGGTMKATTETERAILRQLEDIPGNTPRRLGDITVVAEPPYLAASGRTCRALRLSMGREHRTRERLACRRGASWFFVPNVFASEVGAAD